MGRRVEGFFCISGKADYNGWPLYGTLWDDADLQGAVFFSSPAECSTLNHSLRRSGIAQVK